MRPAFLFALSAALTGSTASAETLAAYAARSKTALAVYTAPSAQSKMMCRVGANQAMAVVPAGPKWYAVVMRTGHPGYAPAQAVEISRDADGNTLGYTKAQIVAFARPTVRSGLGYVASRGGVVRGSNDARALMAVEAQRWEGTTPYKWGGNELVSGIDCSGFVRKMYGAIGLSLPRTAAEQANVGMRITRYEDLQPGDRLYFWDAKRGKIGHTGIYVGGGYFTHSSSGHHGIAKDFLSERWRRICVEARR